ncbi:MAG: flavodoxin family protein [Rhodospirillales bacterium]|nr:flavodoxin family protein [Rhodospirillales bacterium]
MPTVLGVSASLRNARFGLGSDMLVRETKALASEEDLFRFLNDQTRLRVDDLFSAGRRDKRPFDEVYANLRKLKGDRGLSNSEAALVAGLWGAHRVGADIAHIGLAPYFPMTGESRHLDQLRAVILAADAILLSGPVYFGDRGSLAQEFIQFLREDKVVAAHIRDRVYGGIASGAKRNGGQETTLIYQLVDMTNMNMLAVGNDSETTSQYGGTMVAGEVGMSADDTYGLKTSIGTGRRIARVAKMLENGQRNALKDKVKIAIWLLQDAANHHGREMILKLCREVEAKNPAVAFRLFDFTTEEVYRCIACDVCPVSLGPSEEYRCIIKAERDAFHNHHEGLIDSDAILTAAYSPVDRSEVHTTYQRFIERTRYLRRDNYVLGDSLVAPLVISEVNSNQNLHVRMMTSLLRHHTVLHHPLIGFEHEGRVLNWDNMVAQGLSFAAAAARLTAGRLAQDPAEVDARVYRPVGYVISAEKQRQDEKAGKLAEVDKERREALARDRKTRIA